MSLHIAFELRPVDVGIETSINLIELSSVRWNRQLYTYQHGELLLQVVQIVTPILRDAEKNH